MPRREAVRIRRRDPERVIVLDPAVLGVALLGATLALLIAVPAGPGPADGAPLPRTEAQASFP